MALGLRTSRSTGRSFFLARFPLLPTSHPILTKRGRWLWKTGIGVGVILRRKTSGSYIILRRENRKTWPPGLWHRPSCPPPSGLQTPAPGSSGHPPAAGSSGHPTAVPNQNHGEQFLHRPVEANQTNTGRTCFHFHAFRSQRPPRAARGLEPEKSHHEGGLRRL